MHVLKTFCNKLVPNFRVFRGEGELAACVPVQDLAQGVMPPPPIPQNRKTQLCAGFLVFLAHHFELTRIQDLLELVKVQGRLEDSETVGTVVAQRYVEWTE